MNKQDVLIVGAGPTGLVLALWLTQQGITVRIIDKSTGPGTTSRALAVQARTLELYRQLDLADAVIAAGNRNLSINLWIKGKRKAHISVGEAGAGLSPYPFVLIYPQDLHEQLLVERLETLGIRVERQTELIDFEDKGDKITARLQMPNGEEETCEAQYLAGCDGARSTIRHKIGAAFEGGTYSQVFYVADVEVSGLTPPDEVHLALDHSDFVAVLSYGKNGQSRLIGTVRDERAERAETLTFDDVGQQAIRNLGLQVHQVNWFSTYRVHHRVTDRFRSGRAFLLGDAAHIHSPAGGQGMNTGISDAINLAWKLAAAVKGEAPDSLLDSYQAERLLFARKLVDTTDRVFTFVTAESSFADFVRTRIAPLFLPVASTMGPVREFMFRVISQTTLSYHESPLSQGVAGKVHGGDRLPWVSVDGTDNYEPLKTITWQVHVYGSARAELKTWCEAHHLPLHVYAWGPEYEKAGFARDAAYLLRPDTYVALAAPSGAPADLETYLKDWIHGL
ncbi:FAD-dependent oxidoreductase [Stigmatella sp. ncwal1]|uniref:FAD-dependent oxidoreductase n=1 Tax=Stigmatella ashevillensis TaxID=2995309 RepID=A0ABT5DBR0_9BACT|nr:FAD-dependent oxidoreductase [Stigmatella ashevillena]MDC0710238.1 FAD-dependent oxidoreductase [Stigmatella ashevillena]